MKFSENWLRTLVDPPADRAELAHRLTMAGLEVEAITPLGAGLDGVVVGEIVACEAHPDADKLRVCRVDTGKGDSVQVVCGAPNARVGLKAPLATVGARLPGGMEIRAAKLRGVESRGMLCSGAELGMEGAAGLLELASAATTGAAFSDHMDLPDAAFELKLTPNRPDCLGLRGLAFEIATLFGVAPTIAPIEPVAAASGERRGIALASPEDCPRYVGRVLAGVDAFVPTPLWMSERLRRSGIRPVSAVVDCTQYVMLELGQPMHAFDHDTLAGDIVVRRARAGEKLLLLDGREAALDDGMLVIADAERAVALAGIMGGHDTRVTDTTRNLFLEAAHFAPAAIVGRARKLGLHTDASHRFERGVDPELPRLAIERITTLLQEIVGGSAGPLIEAASHAHLPRRPAVGLRESRVARLLGMSLEPDRIEAILHGLDMRAERTADGWSVTPPSRRFDIAIEEDLIEELARVHGYEHVPVKSPGGTIAHVAEPEGRVASRDIRRTLADRGYSEAVNFSFVAEATLAKWQLEGGAERLANPLSAELGVMRTSLLPGLVEAAARNTTRQQQRVRLFELGGIYSGAQSVPRESGRIAGVALGMAAPEQWGATPRKLDFFDIKGDVQQLLGLSGRSRDVSFCPIDTPYLHPGQSAGVRVDAVRIGVVGRLHPRLLHALGLDFEVQVFELELDALAERPLPRAGELSRFPALRRDIAVVVPLAVPVAQLERVVRAAVGERLRELVVFDQFVGAGLPENTRSIAMGLILQDDYRTLTDDDADGSIAAAVGALGAEFGARLRG